MTELAQATATIKFTGLSPKVTEILRRSTTLQQKNHTAAIGRTVAQFEMATDELKLLLDHLVEREITGSGASSKEVKRLRELRQSYGQALAGTDPALTGVRIITHLTADPIREQALNLLAQAWHSIDMLGDSAADAVSELTELAFGKPSYMATQAELRDWLEEHL